MAANFFNRLKSKWGIDSNWQIVVIILVFSLAGPIVVMLRGWYFHFLGFNESTPTYLKIITYLIFIFPAYQVLLLSLGFLFGQFDFFWRKEKALVRALARIFGHSNDK